MPSIFNPQFIGQLLPTILISVALFTLSAGLVGSVFGFFTARGFTSRLGRVSHAADAWSRGDFSTGIPDSTGDELGALSRRLNAMAEQLRALLNTRQDLAALEERNRIARELHDSVKQQVFAASMQLGAARALITDPASPAAQRLEEAQKLTQQAQNELNALIHQLRPVALEGKGLARALRELASDWSRQTGIDARFEQPAGQVELRAPAALPQEQALYRIAQEALANVARHSQARSVRIRYTQSGEQAQLVIEDDGQGFDPRSAPQGVGLQSMRERVESLGGRLDVQSAPGQGARLTIEIASNGEKTP
jgi:NarL family two-component system sensor histidine kinase LiaS